MQLYVTSYVYCDLFKSIAVYALGTNARCTIAV
jgi:hypothetical protein